MPGLMLEAPPHSGKAGAGPNFGRLVGGSITIGSSLPSEVGRKESEFGANEVGELSPGIGVPLSHGFADIGAAEVMHLGIRRRSRRRASRQVPRDLGRFEEFPDLIPKSIAPYQQPARKMWKKTGIFRPLDARNGG